MPDDADRSPAKPRTRLIDLRDIAVLVYLTALVLPAWLTPEAWLLAVGRAIAWSTTHIRPGRTRRDTAALQTLFGDRLRRPAHAHSEVLANTHVHNMLYLRTLRPGGWSPSIRVEGASHIRRALEEGRGVVVWTAPLVYDSLMTKMGLATAGLRVGHLSHLHHYLSRTRFGVRVLNGLVRAVEGRHLAARFVMRPENRAQALRELRRWVEDNRVATVTAVGGSGGRTFAVDFLDGALEVSAGAPELARRAGAQLVAASTIRGRDGSFVTRIEPLPCPEDGRRVETLAAAAGAFAAIVAARITDYPDQCSASLYRVA